MKRKALGRGLAALLPELPEGARQAWAEVEIEQIDPNPFQPRQRIEAARIQELARSVAAQGLVQPLLVRRQGSRYQIVAGERRLRAAREAGLSRVPVVIREVEDSQLLELALIENLQREDLNPIEEAGAYQKLVSDFGFSQEQIAERVGKDRSTVANLIRLLKLPAAVRESIARGEISPGHARPLLSLADAQSQIRIAREVVERSLSVRAVERRVRAAADGGRGKRAPGRADPNTGAAQDRLQRALGTRVRILRRGRAGTIEIAFYSEEDLDRLYEILLRGSRGRV